jgi:cytidine deaminase
LLPEAFGPHDLNISHGLMSIPELQRELRLTHNSEDVLVIEALTAARRSYAPYSGNIAGCSIQTGEGETYAGRYVENAAFDPSLSPFHTAIICMHMDMPFEKRNIKRVVLVERQTGISQRGIIALLLKSAAPDVSLEYHTIE